MAEEQPQLKIEDRVHQVIGRLTIQVTALQVQVEQLEIELSKYKQREASQREAKTNGPVSKVDASPKGAGAVQ